MHSHFYRVAFNRYFGVPPLFLKDQLPQNHDHYHGRTHTFCVARDLHAQALEYTDGHSRSLLLYRYQHYHFTTDRHGCMDAIDITAVASVPARLREHGVCAPSQLSQLRRHHQQLVRCHPDGVCVAHP
ncbi:unnamed protein product [Phytomonas sp. Hart1]|nr:unnamed protein product [Phytomonas sp. Hart1]|eukprot:CCW68228.1 unnamed protein product [Phytomonas sp. isolate Hart1]